MLPLFFISIFIWDMINQLEEKYLKMQEPHRSCLLAVREIILAFDDNLNESIKYGMPFFSYGKKMFCYFWFDKKTKEPYIGFAEGHQMNHPMLIAGNRTRIKIFPLSSDKDLPIADLKKVLDEVVKLMH